jgi:signal peptidase
MKPRIVTMFNRDADRAAARSGGATVALRIVTAAALTALAALGALMLVPTILGYARYVIEGGSMGDAVPRGSIAYEEVVPTREIHVGDVITYRPPGATRLRTHRVAWIGRSTSTGERLYRTKGDANATPDRPAFTLPHATQARVVMHVPLAGYAVAALSIRAVRMAVIGGPALVIAFVAFGSVWRERRRGGGREQQTGSTPAFG